MKKIRFNFVFNRKNKLNKYGEGLIQIRAYQSGKERYFSTDISITPKQWDARRNEVKNHPTGHVLNQQLKEQLDMLKNYEIDTINHRGYCPIDELSLYVRHKGFPSFLEFYEEELENSYLEKSTKQTQRNTLNILKEYRKSIYFRDLTYQFIDGFDNYLRKLKLADTTIHKYHRHLKKYVNLAVKKDYIDVNKNPYKKFKVKRGKSKVRDFLTMPEIDRLSALKFTPEEADLERFRDTFLFGCFTGLRSSDLVRVCKDFLKDTERGIFLKMTATKTGKEINLPLYSLFKSANSSLTRPEELAKKYLEKHAKRYNNHPAYDEDSIFAISYKNFNNSLKIIAERAKIHKHITVHVARHTFGTQMALKVKPTILRELMQHSKIVTTMVYVHLSKELIDDELDNINW